MAKNEGGRWVTINGAHVFLRDAKGGLHDETTNASPHNLRTPPASHAPGHENPRSGNRTQHTGLASMDQPIGGPRPKWMEAENARQIAASEKLARSHKPHGKVVPKGTPMPKMKPMPRGDVIRAHEHRDDVSAVVRHYD